MTSNHRTPIDRERLAELAAEPHFHGGRYRNLAPVPRHGLGDFLRWQLAPGRRFPKGRSAASKTW
ncbi:hypothetical protein [Marinobacter sp. F4206]|uniref:hypothetical protein n=1 Tax=Marinobacter sp. F4206 TaxID=2861777 RepID=UPI00215152F9|nr:hypothetical protein [Marinobacter sp. F4206]